MRSKIVLIILFLMYLTPGFSQDWSEITSNNEVYLYGEGVGSSIEEADQLALANLISKISLVVSSDFSIIEDEQSKNGELNAESYTHSKIQTYSNATLTNAMQYVIKNDIDEYHIGRYIKRTDVDRIFEERKTMLKEYVRLAGVAEKALKIDDALRNYYWSYAIVTTIPHAADFSYIDGSTGEEIHPLTWLPEKMNTIFDGLRTEVTGNDGTYVDLKFTYNNVPVTTLDFKYYDGRIWSQLSSVKDGVGTMEFVPNMVPNDVPINYEYAYRNQSHINMELKGILETIKGQTFRKARSNIATKLDNAEKIAKEKQQNIYGKLGIVSNDFAKVSNASAKTLQKSASDNAFAVAKWDIAAVKDEAPYRNTLLQVVDAIVTKDYTGLEEYFTEDGMEMFNKLIKYGKARVLSTDSCHLYQFRNNVVARSIKMSFSFARGVRKNFVDDIVFTFNKDKKIDCVAFGLDNSAKRDILNKEVWPLVARQTLMEFLENYKTAYALKRLDYLDAIFDEHALIISGHVTKRAVKVDNGDGPSSYQMEEFVKTQRFTKQEYLKHLKSVFASNEFINIRFANNDVRKARDREEYGIQIKQDYYSTNYGDQGYLYLQVDVTNPDEPILMVRVWQPKPDPEFGLYDMTTIR